MDRLSGLASELAADLLRIGAVRFSPEAPFTWTSGIRAPVYCDNRLTIGHVDVRRRIVEGFLLMMEREQINADVVAGTATAGIPHAAWLAADLDLPMVYVRSKPKAHGTASRIEGPVQDDARVVLVEDLISTGGSSIDAAEALAEAGLDVSAVLSIFTYGLPVASSAFGAAGLSHHSLTDIETLVRQASQSGMLDESAISALRRWKEDPKAWSEAYMKREKEEDEG